jgi:hypothetical protein
LNEFIIVYAYNKIFISVYIGKGGRVGCGGGGGGDEVFVD